MTQLQKGMCQYHTRSGPEFYAARAEWAMARIEKGERQKQCRDCRYWFFPEEMGNKNAT